MSGGSLCTAQWCCHVTFGLRRSGGKALAQVRSALASMGSMVGVLLRKSARFSLVGAARRKSPSHHRQLARCSIVRRWRVQLSSVPWGRWLSSGSVARMSVFRSVVLACATVWGVVRFAEWSSSGPHCFGLQRGGLMFGRIAVTSADIGGFVAAA